MEEKSAGRGALPPPPKPLERRRASRHPAKIAGYLGVEDDEEQHLGLVRNISDTGALVLTRGVFEVADTVRMTLYLPGGAERSAAGRIVRGERVTDERADLWPYEVALRFDTAIDFAREIADLTEQQVKLGVIKR